MSQQIKSCSQLLSSVDTTMLTDQNMYSRERVERGREIERKRDREGEGERERAREREREMEGKEREKARFVRNL